MMTEHDIERLRREVEEEIDPLYAGLEVAQRLSASPVTDRLTAVILWMREKVASKPTPLESKNYWTLFEIGEDVFLTVEERKAYARALFLACLGEREETVDNGASIFPIRQPSPDYDPPPRAA